MRRSVATWLSLLACACQARTSELLRADEVAHAHVRAFAEFDRWARRVVGSDGLPRSTEALAETVFAPLRSDRSVLAMWVRSEGDRALFVALPSGVALPRTGFVAVRDSALGPLEVLASRPCALALPARWRPEPAGCALVSRKQRAEGRTVTVTVAFVDPRPLDAR